MRASKLLSLLLIVIFCAPAWGGSPKVLHRFAKQHRAEHWIVSENGSDAAGCTGTAIGPHAILTAQHCELEDNGRPLLFFVDPVEKPDYLTAQTPYKIVDVIHDGSDHSIFLVSGPAFKNIAPVDIEAPQQGENVLWWGNPEGIRDQLREGYVMGTQPAPVPEQAYSQQMFMVDAPAIPGDSGSAVLDARTGAIVGVVTYGINGGEFMGMFALHFSDTQLLVAGIYDGRAL